MGIRKEGSGSRLLESGAAAGRVAFALAAVAAAWAVRTLLDPYFGDQHPFLFFTGALAATAWFAGLWPSILTLLLGLIVTDYCFISPRHTIAFFHGASINHVVANLGFIGVGAVIIYVAETSRRHRYAIDNERQRWRVTLASIGEAVIATDREDRVVFMNPVAELVTGGREAEARGIPLPGVLQLIDEETREPLPISKEEIFKHGAKLSFQTGTALLTKEKREVPLRYSAAPIHLNGREDGIVLVFRDISAERQLMDSQANLAAMVEHSVEAMIRKDLSGVINYWNRGAEKLFGYSKEEILGKNITVLLPPQQRLEEDEILRRLGQGEPIVHFNTVRLHKNGTLLNVSLTISPIKNRKGIVTGAVAVAHDISLIKMAEEALRHSQARLDGIIKSAMDAIISINVDQKVVLFNPAAERVFACSASSAMGESIDRFIPPKFRDNHREQVKAFGKTGVTNRRMTALGELTAIRANGEEFPIEASISQVEVDGEKLFTVILRDITERKQVEDALSQAREDLERRVVERTRQLTEANERLKEVDRLKSEFLATMSHELRTPLNSILGFTGMVKDGFAGPIPEEAATQLEMAYDSARHLLNLINDLLDLSRIEAGRVELFFENVDFKQLVEEVVSNVQLLARQKGLSIVTEIEVHEPVHIDRKRVFQILLNLVNNAVKFTHKGGVHIAAKFEGPDLVVSVADTGIGISSKQIPALFEAFRQGEGSLQRKYEGTGLGLYLTKKLLELLKGTISVESEFGRGTQMTFRIPFSQEGGVR